MGPVRGRGGETGQGCVGEASRSGSSPAVCTYVGLVFHGRRLLGGEGRGCCVPGTAQLLAVESWPTKSRRGAGGIVCFFCRMRAVCGGISVACWWVETDGSVLPSFKNAVGRQGRNVWNRRQARNIPPPTHTHASAFARYIVSCVSSCFVFRCEFS